MQKIGRKTRQWIKDRSKLITDAVAEGRIVVKYGHGFSEGVCEDCRKWKQLDPDHRLKRSQGGTHDKSNIDWVCRECHDKRDNRGDPMNKKPKSKKADWQKEHECSCGAVVSTLICPHCGRLSIKERGK